MNLHLSFHEMILLAYALPNIYIFFRIFFLFIDKEHRLSFSIIYILIASVYPLSNYLPERGGNFPVRLIHDISDYILPFYLYLFLFTLLFDIFLLINIFLRIIPTEKRKTRQFKKSGLIILISMAAAVVIGGVINFNTIRISEYDITVPARSSGLQNLKVAFAADFHLGDGTCTGFVKRFKRKIEAINPDILLFGGDIAEGRNGTDKMLMFENILGGIKPKYGKYTVLGNHEFYSGHNDGLFFKKAGVEVLYDSSLVIGRSFNLAGRLDAHSKRKSLNELLRQADSSLPVIILDHRPTEITAASKTMTDVQFSGHTHDGQLFPINFITHTFYVLTWGYRKIENTHFFVTSGIRLWGPPVRTIAKSEIMVVNIAFENGSKTISSK